jgi:lipopolysaccharide export system protein LptC
MKVRVSNLLPLLLMFFLAALTIWLRIAVEGPRGGGSSHVRHDPDAIVDNLQVTRLNEHGSPQDLITATRMIHFADDDGTELVGPQMIRRSEGGELTITADRGTVTHGGEQAYFYDNVLVVRAATAEREELRMRTDYLHVLAEKHVARTDRPVTITEGQSTLSGVGMEYDDNAHQFALHSKVRGTFVQTKK